MGSTAASPPRPLTDAEKEHFMTHGWLHLTDCFTPEQAQDFTRDVWVRLGMSPDDKSNWRLRTNMPAHRLFDASEFAPKAWSAILELCGGEERVAEKSKEWRDTLIVNLGTDEGEGQHRSPKTYTDWHVDGDFFVHYLDSQEQALLVVPLFTKIVPGGGGTFICPEAIPKVARHLYEHPEGVSPRMTLRGQEDFAKEKDLAWFNALANETSSDEAFVEVTGEIGDVFLLHPLMLHAPSHNPLRKLRIITNPPVSLKQPHCFDRPDGDYSLVERATLRALGKESLPGWKPTQPREEVIPERVRIQAKMKEEELKRLEQIRAVRTQA